MAALDVLIDIRYNLWDPSKTIIFTNAKTEALEEIIEEWLLRQIGEGADDQVAVTRDIYVIKIGLVIGDDGDRFYTEANTDDKGLTAGIMMKVLQGLGTMDVRLLSERPDQEAHHVA